MINLVRNIVAGPKRKVNFEGLELDMTYITDRVIAMAYPASDLIQKTYRNSIDDVSNYLDQTHKNKYLILNVSGRAYDYSRFNDMVREYNWPDHQTPPLSTLFLIAYEMMEFLQKNAKNVVVIHCNHGKGRTGTAIISLFLFVEFQNSAKQALEYYNGRRFYGGEYGVDQPCQVRYLEYVQSIIQTQKLPTKLFCYRLKKITQKGLDQNFEISISAVRSQKVKIDHLGINQKIGEKEQKQLMMGDIFIEIYQNSWKGLKRISRINYNLYFLPKDLIITFKSKDIKIQKSQCNFKLSFQFQYYCLCHLPIYQNTKCLCQKERNVEELEWKNMIVYNGIAQEVRKRKEFSQLLFWATIESLQQKRQKLKQSFKKDAIKRIKSTHKNRLQWLALNTKNQRKKYLQLSSEEDEKHQNFYHRTPSQELKNQINRNTAEQQNNFHLNRNQTS